MAELTDSLLHYHNSKVTKKYSKIEVLLECTQVQVLLIFLNVLKHQYKYSKSPKVLTYKVLWHSPDRCTYKYVYHKDLVQ